MDAGDLNRRVTFLAAVTSQGDRSKLTTTWTPAITTWACIKDLTAALIYAPSEYVSKVVKLITIRYRSASSVSAGMRVQYLDATTGITHLYEVQSVTNLNADKQWVQVRAQELDGAE